MKLIDLNEMEMIISVVYVNAMYIPGIINTVSSILRMRIRRLVPLDPVCARLALRIVHPEPEEPLEPSALSSDHGSEIPNQFPGIPWESYLYLIPGTIETFLMTQKYPPDIP